MEKHMQYLTWVKSKAPVTMGSTSLKRSREEEELGFAEDIGGGGFVWPPRSYSCTFCRREFRSAQALGGHMNVHRRDRARLKQSLSLHQKITTPLSSTNLLHFHDLQDGNFSSKRVTRSGNSSSRRKELGSSSNAIVSNNEEFNNYKRHKKGTISSSVGFLHKQCSSINNRYIIQPEGLRIIKANNNLSLEDIDLELRLG